MPHIRTLDLQISPVSSVVTVAIRRDSILQNHRLTINTDGKGCVLISVKKNVRYDRAKNLSGLRGKNAGGGFVTPLCPSCLHRDSCGLYRATDPVSVTSCVRFKEGKVIG